MNILKTLRSSWKRASSIGMAATLVGIMCAAAIPLGHAAAATANPSAPFTTGAKVSFTFDDGIGNDAAEAAPELAQYGYAGTAYIITGCVGMTTTPNTCAANGDVGYMTWDQIHTLQTTYGWEIGSHTVDHPLTAAVDNPSLTDAQLDAEMADSQASLATQGFNATDFASPYGDYDNRSLAVIAKYYNSHRAFQDYSQPAANELSSTFPYYSPRDSFPYNPMLLTVEDVQGNVPVATVEGYINQAKANNQWLILVFHNVVASGASTAEDDYQYNAADLGAIAAYVKSQNIPVTDIAHGLDTSSTNLFANGNFTNGIADGWTTDNATAITANQQAATKTAAGTPSALNGHGAYDGTPEGPLDSILLTNNSATTDTHLFSPMVNVDPTQTYVFNNYVNVTSTAGEVDFIVDEYNASGTYLSDQYVQGVTGSTNTQNVQVGNVNFLYKPTSSSVASVRLQVIAHGTGLNAYYDNAQMFPESTAGSGVPSNITNITNPTQPTTKPGDLNGDGKVDALDLSVLLANWNKTGVTAAQGDVNGDGTVNALDLSILLMNWSK
jgi:peptidoglycan/xylan/chitin deacetylase (PgdA/CDA1 family)